MGGEGNLESVDDGAKSSGVVDQEGISDLGAELGACGGTHTAAAGDTIIDVDCKVKNVKLGIAGVGVFSSLNGINEVNAESGLNVLVSEGGGEDGDKGGGNGVGDGKGAGEGGGGKFGGEGGGGGAGEFIGEFFGNTEEGIFNIVGVGGGSGDVGGGGAGGGEGDGVNISIEVVDEVSIGCDGVCESIDDGRGCDGDGDTKGSFDSGDDFPEKGGVRGRTENVNERGFKGGGIGMKEGEDGVGCGVGGVGGVGGIVISVVEGIGEDIGEDLGS